MLSRPEIGAGGTVRRNLLDPFAGVGCGIAASAALVALLPPADWAAMWRASGALALAGTLAVALLLPSGDESSPASRARPTTVRDPEPAPDDPGVRLRFWLRLRHHNDTFCMA